MKRRRLKRKSPFFLFLIAFLFLLAGAAMLANELWHKLGGSWYSMEGDVEASQPIDSFTILLLGTDARPGETVARTDTIIVAHVRSAEKRLSLLSIPRDARVYIPGHGMDKINAAYVYGGPELSTRVVSNLIGIPVKYYALTNWEGFKDIVDTLGGVTIDVEKRMDYYDRADGPEYAIHLEPGVQRLDGEKALQYVRYRNDAMGDISRTERQLKFLKALTQEMLQPATVVKLPKLVPQINKCLDTNLGLREMIVMARLAKDFDQTEIVTQTLPGHFLDTGDGSYWAVDAWQARQVARALFENGEVTEVVQGTAVRDAVYSARTVSTQADEAPGTRPSASGNWQPVISQHTPKAGYGLPGGGVTSEGKEDHPEKEQVSPVTNKSSNNSGEDNVTGDSNEPSPPDNAYTDSNADQKISQGPVDTKKSNEEVIIIPLPQADAR